MEFFSSVVVGRGRGAYSSSRRSRSIRKKEEWIDTKSFIIIKRWVSFVLSRKCPSHLLANTPPNTRRGRQKSKRGAKAPETTATVGDLVATLPDAFDSSRFSRVDVSPPVASVLLPGDFFFARTKKKSNSKRFEMTAKSDVCTFLRVRRRQQRKRRRDPRTSRAARDSDAGGKTRRRHGC